MLIYLLVVSPSHSQEGHISGNYVPLKLFFSTLRKSYMKYCRTEGLIPQNLKSKLATSAMFGENTDFIESKILIAVNINYSGWNSGTTLAKLWLLLRQDIVTDGGGETAWPQTPFILDPVNHLLPQCECINLSGDWSCKFAGIGRLGVWKNLENLLAFNQATLCWWSWLYSHSFNSGICHRKQMV